MDKDYIRAKMSEFEANIIGVICNGLSHGLQKAQIIRKIKREVDKLAYSTKILLVQQNYLLVSCLKYYRDIYKLTYLDLKVAKKLYKYDEDYRTNLQKRFEHVYKAVNKELIITRRIKKDLNSVLRVMESAEKTNNLRADLNKSRASDSYSPFWLCSYHSGSATDHAKWQGRVYYDEFWEVYIKNELLRSKIRAYISNHNCKTIQYITGAPVYMVLRPNCEHFMTNVNISSVLSSSVKSLLKANNAIINSIPKTHEQIMCDSYKDRLELRQQLYDIIPNPKLAEDIKNDKQYVRKWARLAASK